VYTVFLRFLALQGRSSTIEITGIRRSFLLEEVSISESGYQASRDLFYYNGSFRGQNGRSARIPRRARCTPFEMGFMHFDAHRV
jgi:hypothetical protein